MAIDLREFAQRGLHLERPRPGGPGGDEGAPALLGRDQPLALQQRDGLPHGDAGECEFLDQVLERRQARSRLPDATLDAAPQDVGQLRIARQRGAPELGLSPRT